MDQYGEAVLDYLCGQRKRFINAQFTLPNVGLLAGRRNQVVGDSRF
jgi:hypothetical protein